jgi:hypothetical protein
VAPPDSPTTATDSMGPDTATEIHTGMLISQTVPCSNSEKRLCSSFTTAKPLQQSFGQNAFQIFHFLGCTGALS